MKTTSLDMNRTFASGIAVAMLLALSCGLIACGESQPSPSGDPPAQPVPANDTQSQQEVTAPAKLVAAQIGAIKNLHQAGDVYFAAQPTAEDFPLLAGEGIKHVVNYRLPSEVAEIGEDRLVADNGMTYHDLGYRTPESLTDELFDLTRQILRESKAADEKVLLHCASANRAGAVWMTYRVLDEGVALDTAIKEAQQVGLKSAELEAIATQYIERKQNDAP